MDVINLSLGEPEIEPSRDIVVKALDNAADAGVISVVAAGNDFGDAGRGSIGSPGTAPEAITVAASTEGDDGPADVIAGFSSSGPTPISLQMKPDVTAPGVDLLSSLPHNQWSNHDWSGTSMAAPHVAAAAALLKERHPAWTACADQVGSRVDRRTGASGRLGDGADASPRRRRPHRSAARGQPARLHRSKRALVRPRHARHHLGAAARARRRGRRPGSLDDFDRPADDAARREPFPLGTDSRCGDDARCHAHRRSRRSRGRRARLSPPDPRLRRAPRAVLAARRSAEARH